MTTGSPSSSSIAPRPSRLEFAGPESSRLRPPARSRQRQRTPPELPLHCLRTPIPNAARVCPLGHDHPSVAFHTFPSFQASTTRQGRQQYVLRATLRQVRRHYGQPRAGQREGPRRRRERWRRGCACAGWPPRACGWRSLGLERGTVSSRCGVFRPLLVFTITSSQPLLQAVSRARDPLVPVVPSVRVRRQSLPTLTPKPPEARGKIDGAETTVKSRPLALVNEISPGNWFVTSPKQSRGRKGNPGSC